VTVEINLAEALAKVRQTQIEDDFLATNATYRRAVAWQSKLLLLEAECLVTLAFATSPDAGNRQARLDELRSELEARTALSKEEK
jgi:hypothetical protein